MKKTFTFHNPTCNPNILTQVIRLTIAERILLISGNVDWRDQRKPRGNQGFQSRGYGIRRMKQIVHLVD